MFSVALPLAEVNSAKRDAEILLPLIDDETCVVSYDETYAASLVFYTGAKIYRLETEYHFNQIKPQKMSWTSKNVMPFMTFDELPEDKKILAVVNVALEGKFLDNTYGKWKLVGELPKGSLESFAENFFYGRERRKLKAKIFRRDPNGSRERPATQE